MVPTLVLAVLVPLASLPPGPAPVRQDSDDPRAVVGDLDPRAPLFELPDLKRLVRGGMRDVITRYRTDQRTLQRFYDVAGSPKRLRGQREMTRAWLGALEDIEFERLGQDDRIDFLLLRNKLEYELRRYDLDEAKRKETDPLLPFRGRITELQERRRSLLPLDAEQAAGLMVELQEQVEDAERWLRSRFAGEADQGPPAVTVTHRAAGEARALRRTLEDWYSFYDRYDPLFTWWVAEPYGELERALGEYADLLEEPAAQEDDGAGDEADPIIGDPIGAQGLEAELAREWIPYSPAELIGIAESEFAWCDREMADASRELGFGEDWRAAQAHVKGLHVGPGEQPELIRQLAFEAIDFLEERDLLTIPALAKNSWRMEMMSPERQRYTPYFTGGEVISVSFPTGDMRHADKLMSMRGNNVHFSRATVHHELIPGHHLQQFMNARHRTYRREFATPFWGEGWALYWEMLLYDAGFPTSPEDRIGMLFWRKHRCARILFTLRFHLKEWTPSECIEFLVERVGHEVKNATAEVRRSVQGGYGPLYQAAYMLGGLQFRALHAERVLSGNATARAHHDAILRQNSIPVELLRAKLTGQELAQDDSSRWRFYRAIERR